MSQITKRRQLAPRTSEDEALFIATQYKKNRSLLEAKLANSINGGRALRQLMLDRVAEELSAKFSVAKRSRKYVEQKLRDMKKEARKCFRHDRMAHASSSHHRMPSEAIHIMMTILREDGFGSISLNTTSDEFKVLDQNDHSSPRMPENQQELEAASISSSSFFEDFSKANLDMTENPMSFPSNSPVSNTFLTCQPFYYPSFMNPTRLLKQVSSETEQNRRNDIPFLISHANMEEEFRSKPLSGFQSSNFTNLFVNAMSTSSLLFPQNAQGISLKARKGNIGRNKCKQASNDLTPLNQLQRALLMEEINAAKAFASLCEQVKLSVEIMRRS
ncbi:hypothetical protein DdX_08728 [Ditylenchus destructor]|uniref:Regulatory protein zeste n=1 Tax=Ditylenchus destructor TaxID=166010 RepID=A0AAD4N788_9BILA|nr:hypothetical protein DdX_08728 [Ditylenchus destructor]